MMPYSDKSRYFLFLAVLSGLLGMVMWLQAATPIFVRPGGNDTLCDGTVNVDYSAGVAPDCAVAAIQKGIDLVDAGGEVQVAAGIYTETITLNKSLTLLGPQADVDPRTTAALRTPGSANEAVLDGNGVAHAVNLAADNITINGLEVTNCSNDCINLLASPQHNNIVIKYVILHNIADEAIQLRNSLDSILDHNLAFNVAGDGFTMSNSLTRNATITNNEVYASSSPDAAIQIDEGGGIVRVENNYIHDNQSGAGISSYHPAPGDVSNPTEIYVRNNVIQNNQFSSTSSRVYRHGDAITMYRFATATGPDDKLVIEGNQIENNTGVFGTETTGHGVTVIHASSLFFAPTTVQSNMIRSNSGFGVFVSFPADKPVTILDNALSGNGQGGVFVNHPDVTVKGNDIEASPVAFWQESGSLTAYANNVLTYTTAVSATIGVTQTLSHNWWGRYDGAIPTGLDAAEWQARLGAPVAAWVDGEGSAALNDSGNGGQVQLSGGTGTAVVVSYGRAASAVDAPFGNGIIGHVNNTCSDFYDFFTVGGSGTWTAQIPLDSEAAHPGCGSTLSNQKAYWIPAGTDYGAVCSPVGNTSCWPSVTPARISTNGQTLQVNNLTVPELGGTPFVAGDSYGFSPTPYVRLLPVVFKN